MGLISVDIKDMLEAKPILGLIFGKNLFVGRMPSAPYDSVTIFDINGAGIERAITKERYERGSILIKVRAVKLTDGANMANAIQDYLLGLPQSEWNGSYYTVIRSINGVYMDDWDTNNNSVFTIYINIQRR